MNPLMSLLRKREERSPELQVRVARMRRIVQIMTDRALSKGGKKRRQIRTLADSQKLREQMVMIDKLSDEDFLQFIDLLEAGVPDDLKHMLQSKQES